MSARFSRKIARVERLLAVITDGSRGLPDKISSRMLSHARALRPMKFRFGHLRRLPQAYHDERHIVIGNRLPDRDGREWFEFHEKPGSKPGKVGPLDRGPIEYRNVIFVKPYPVDDRTTSAPGGKKQR